MFPVFPLQRVHQQEIEMNRDQVKGTMKDVAGKIQRKVGEITGSTSQQIKGGAKQVAGKVQKTVGNVRDDADKRRNEDRDEKKTGFRMEARPAESYAEITPRARSSTTSKIIWAPHGARIVHAAPGDPCKQYARYQDGDLDGRGILRVRRRPCAGSLHQPRPEAHHGSECCKKKPAVDELFVGNSRRGCRRSTTDRVGSTQLPSLGPSGRARRAPGVGRIRQ